MTRTVSLEKCCREKIEDTFSMLCHGTNLQLKTSDADGSLQTAGGAVLPQVKKD